MTDSNIFYANRREIGAISLGDNMTIDIACLEYCAKNGINSDAHRGELEEFMNFYRDIQRKTTAENNLVYKFFFED